jgi:hypothetical protein
MIDFICKKFDDFYIIFVIKLLEGRTINNFYFYFIMK